MPWTPSCDQGECQYWSLWSRKKSPVSKPCMAASFVLPGWAVGWWLVWQWARRPSAHWHCKRPGLRSKYGWIWYLLRSILSKKYQLSSHQWRDHWFLVLLFYWPETFLVAIWKETPTSWLCHRTHRKRHYSGHFYLGTSRFHEPCHCQSVPKRTKKPSLLSLSHTVF